MGSLAPFGVRETHGILIRPGAEIRASSDRRWSSIFASAQREHPYEGLFPAVNDQLLVLHVSGPVEVVRRLGANTARCAVPAGGIHLIPGGMELGVALAGVLDTVHCYIRRAVIEEVAGDLIKGDPAKIEIPAVFAELEPSLRNLIHLVEFELEDDDNTMPCYIDYLSRAIAARLVRRHSTGQLTEERPDRKAHAGPIVARAIGYMHEHIERSLSLDDIATAAGRSPSHFARQFRSEVGEPPHQYLLKLRVEKAQELLAGTRLPIAEIALMCGFSHQEHMTRLFRRRCDTTPAAYRRARRS